MMPSLPRMSQGKRRVWLVVTQLLGMLLGFVVLLILAITEPESDC